MSITQTRSESGQVPVQRLTAATLIEKKRAGEPITALTAYDYPSARLVDEAGIDLVLVGDSLGMTTLGYENTLPVTMEEMLHHTRAVARGVRRGFLVADMPYGTYQVSDEEAVRNAMRFVKEAGAQAIKIEGGARRAALVRRFVEAEVSVVGHIGLTPQSVHGMSGYRVQGRTSDAAEALYSDALALEDAGAIAIVLEGIPREVAAEITARASVPTIGIGAGPECDGQILVFADLVGLSFTPAAKFVRRYADGAAFFADALARYREDVAARSFPNDAESYHLSRVVREQLEGLSLLKDIDEVLPR
jgi:3-methyl-2-oxobutanoate hydroxymethyltransferase